ncbi:hypothetical protein JVU11DRAFT_10060 [Chiua virens]|nr:hypothetical protein JVU11DRAFT_10060 [Chiua virens]
MVKVMELDLLASWAGKHHGSHGSISWIMDGFQIEEAQIMLKMQIKDLGPKPTDTQLLVITQKREQLEADISRFNTSAVEFVGRIVDQDDEPTLVGRTTSANSPHSVQAVQACPGLDNLGQVLELSSKVPM